MKKQHSLALSLIFVAAVVVASPSTGLSQAAKENAEARALFNQGVTFQHDGNLVEAEKKFRESLRRFPKAEGADQTAYYLIDTLVKLSRLQEARTEIENFRRNYPRSKWQTDVNEKMISLGGQPTVLFESGIWNSPAELREAQARADLLRGAITPAGKPYDDELPPNASYKAELLHMIIQMDRDKGIEDAKQLLKANPSDPAVVANFGTIANSESPLAAPLLFSVWTNVSATPNVRNNAFFWFSRANPDKEEVAKAVMDLLSKRENEMVASQALYRLTVADHRAVLEKIVNSSNPDKFALMGKIYRNGSALLKSDLLMFVGRLNDSRSVQFIVDSVQNERDASVRLAALQALRVRKDVDVAVLQRLMNTPPPPQRGTQPTRLAAPTGSALPAIPFLPGTSN